MCGGTSKIPRLQKHIASMFPNAEQLNSISPDEVLALGAASQSSLLNEAWLDTDNNVAELETVRTKMVATGQEICYNLKLISNKESDTPDDNLPVTLIPAGTPIPARKSYHLTEKDINMLQENGTKLLVTFYTKSCDITIAQITKVYYNVIMKILEFRIIEF